MSRKHWRRPRPAPAPELVHALEGLSDRALLGMARKTLRSDEREALRRVVKARGLGAALEAQGGRL